MKKQTVYISAHLPFDTKNKEKYGEKVYQKLHAIEEIEIVEIQDHCKNVWSRDYMPVQSGSGNLVHFIYAPSYMTDSAKWKARRPDREILQKKLQLDCANSTIILDGGAIEILGKKAILSDRVFRDNKKPEEDIINEITNLLELDQLIIVPQHPFDFTGHVDGLVRFIDDKTVLISEMLVDGVRNEVEVETNGYRKKLIDNWYYSFKYSLLNAGLKLKTLPCTAYRNPNDQSGHGIYLNFLKLNNLIIMPSYGQPEDDVAKQKLESFYKCTVQMVDSAELSAEGGMINCVTWSR